MLRPNVRQLPTQWAAVKRVMPPDSPEPGPYRPERTPYMIPPVAAAVSFRYRGIGIVCGTQQGKTAALFNIGGEKIDNDAAPFLWIGPTKSNVQNVIVPQFDAMIEGCESLKSKMQSGRQKSLMKKIGGTTVRFAWAGSATEIASQPAHTVVVDEASRTTSTPAASSSRRARRRRGAWRPPSTSAPGSSTGRSRSPRT
jgi:phage terminase large subunit GpA-like protein